MKLQTLTPIKPGNLQAEARNLKFINYILTFLVVTSTSLSFKAVAQLKVATNGFVGINNTNPSFGLDVEGTGRYSGWTDVYLNWSGLSGSPVIFPENSWYLQLGKSTNKLGNIFTSGIHTTSLWWDSDGDLKTNIQPITAAVEIIQSLNGRTYNFTDSYLADLPESEKSQYNQTQYGFIAEELQGVLPTLVSVDSPTTRSSINYVAIIPILVEAIKQQQARIDELAASGVTTGFVASVDKKQTKGAVLFQNIPNPYTEKTEIKFTIPQGGMNAMLLISNLSGEQIKKYTIAGSGTQTITIDGGEFAAGSYYYTLIVDNREVDTKKMILVK